MIEIVEYDVRWPDGFREVADGLRDALGAAASRIDHIGSTAVPGLPAKKRIDVQVGIADLTLAPEVVARLTARGYRQPYAVANDHVPAGTDILDPTEWAKAFVQTPLGAEPVANIHIREIGRANWRYALLFRDYLRTHPLAAAAYGELKRRLADVATDIETYTAVKDPAVDLVMVGAEAWAEATRWRPGEI